MEQKTRNILEKTPIEASAPCRIDMGGTLDIKTFYFPLRHLFPCTFNIAVDLRTDVRLLPYDKNKVKISSRGFKSAEYAIDEAPFDHPLGLMFAVAAYYRAKGVHIIINSSSPPRSALGGSSSAAVALVAALAKVSEIAGDRPISRMETALLAHNLEESVAGVPCGLQDQLASAYGGVNGWYWQPEIKKAPFKKKIVSLKKKHVFLQKNILLAYCGIPHESRDINSRWIKQFLSGKDRNIWADIIGLTEDFICALYDNNIPSALKAMNAETALRRKLTPDVVDTTGKKLINSAIEKGCGARFTGAGGGGCIWAIGEVDNISDLQNIWQDILSHIQNACLLNCKIDSKGLVVTNK